MSEAGRRVRVCDDAVFMVFARRAAGQAAGHPFFGSFLWSEQRNERKKDYKIFRISCFSNQPFVSAGFTLATVCGESLLYFKPNFSAWRFRERWRINDIHDTLQNAHNG